MLITCPECTTRYNLTAAQIGPEGRMLKCAKCGHQWFVPPETAPEPDPDIPPPLPPENPVGMDELAFVGSQPAWWRRFGANMTLWLMGLTGVLGVTLAIAIWMLLGHQEPGEVGEGEIAPITDPQPEHLVLSDLTRDIQEDGSLVILKFSGKITNDGPTAQTLPELRLQLLDAKGIELDFWPADMGKPVLEPGESTHWTARFLNPPLPRIASWRAFFKTTSVGQLLPAQVANDADQPAESEVSASEAGTPDTPSPTQP